MSADHLSRWIPEPLQSTEGQRNGKVDMTLPLPLFQYQKNKSGMVHTKTKYQNA